VLKTRLQTLNIIGNNYHVLTALLELEVAWFNGDLFIALKAGREINQCPPLLIQGAVPMVIDSDSTLRPEERHGQEKFQILAFYDFTLQISAESGTEGELEELLWDKKTEWIEEALEELKVQYLQPKFEYLIYPRLIRFERGSITGTIALVLAGGVALYNIISQYRDFYESITLLRQQLTALLNHAAQNVLEWAGVPGVPPVRVIVREFLGPDLPGRREPPVIPPLEERRPAMPWWMATAQCVLIAIVVIALVMAIAYVTTDGKIVETLGISQTASTDVLLPRQSYDFEGDPIRHFSLVGNTVDFSIDAPGFNSNRSLQLNLRLAPYASVGQGGFRCELENSVRAQAISAYVRLLQEPVSSEPIYAQFVVDTVNGGRKFSPRTQLKSDRWTPMFWGSPFNSWENPEIRSVQMWILRYNEPYNGAVCVDDLKIYELAKEQPANLALPLGQ
jgi:hypothetical protein